MSEAQRILFDPLLAVHTSVVDPLPHQITAVYEAMLPRQPLRFLLVDDPGAGPAALDGPAGGAWSENDRERHRRRSTMTTIRIDGVTHARLEDLARSVHRPIADIVATLSYADYDVLLELHARRAVAERPQRARTGTAGDDAAGPLSTRPRPRRRPTKGRRKNNFLEVAVVPQ